MKCGAGGVVEQRDRRIWRVGRARGPDDRRDARVAYPTGYPSTKSVRLWKVAAGKMTSVTVATGSAEKTQTAIAADTKGRLWVVWAQHAPGRDRVYVRRSNTGAPAFGPARYYVVPNGYQSVYHLAAAVRSGKLDVVAHLGWTKGEATWHIQFKPPA